MSLDKTLHLMAAACGLGAPDPHCADGPETLLAQGLAERLANGRRRISRAEIIRPQPVSSASALERVAEVCARLAQETCAAATNGAFPVVLAGDHSCAVGTWSGMSRALAAHGRLGLLWIDAHLDSHTPETSPSAALHGMPLAALLGYGDASLTDCAGAGPKLLPEHVCVVGAHSFEAEEGDLLARLGVRVFDMAEIDRRGLAAVFADALAIVQSGTAGFGLTIDLDAIDPRDAPGVGSPEPEGIRGEDLRAELARMAGNPNLVAAELAEFNPRRDRDCITARLALDLLDALLGDPATSSMMALERKYGAPIYAPLPVVLARGEGVHVWDLAGNRYLDMMSAYSAVSHGHAHPRLVQALTAQARTLAVTSRAYFNDRLPLLLERLANITGLDHVIPVNTGLEAVEAALKSARKWAYRVKGVAPDQAEIIACDGNFHGRSIAIVAMSSEPQYRDGFGPYPPGFRNIPYADAQALEAAITPNTAAFIVEPIQGEAGVVVPPAGYLSECERICRKHNVLLILDEVQTGLGRTGRLFAFQHEEVMPDGLILGKALGGGLLPVSAFVARRAVTRVFEPGDHGSTFGGNPLAAAVALEAIDVLFEERLCENAALLGNYFIERLRTIRSPLIREVRGKGLLIGIEVAPSEISARAACEMLLARGILSKDTQATVLRFAPPLVINREQIDWAVEQIRQVFEQLGDGVRASA